jgi:hypothetical protein
MKTKVSGPEGNRGNKVVLCQPSIDRLVGQVVNLSLDRMPSCPTYQTNIDKAVGARNIHSQYSLFLSVSSSSEEYNSLFDWLFC